MKITKSFISKTRVNTSFLSPDWQVNRLSEIDGGRLVSVLPYPLTPVLQYIPYTSMCEDLFRVGYTEIIFESSVFENRINYRGNPDGKEAIFSNNAAKAKLGRRIVDYD